MCHLGLKLRFVLGDTLHQESCFFLNVRRFSLAELARLPFLSLRELQRMAVLKSVEAFASHGNVHCSTDPNCLLLVLLSSVLSLLAASLGAAPILAQKLLDSSDSCHDPSADLK